MSTKLDARQIALRSSLAFIGSAGNATLDTIFPKINNELAKLFEDRNALLSDGGTITFTGTQIQFSENLNLVINQKISGASPQVISLGSTTVNITNLGIWYAIVDRTAGTATTAVASTLPAVTSANQEIFLIAKRIDAGDATVRLYFRNGFTMNAGDSSRLGESSGGGSSIFLDNVFKVENSTDPTKIMALDVSGVTTGTTRTLTVPDANTTIVGTDAVQTLLNKSFGDAITGVQIATPSNPAASKDKAYFKSDDGMYILDSAGQETLLGNPTLNVTGISSYLSGAFQSFVDQSSLMAATATTGSPASGFFYSSISKRASMVDFLQDLKPRFGAERLPIYDIYQIPNEFGPSGEQIWGVINDQFSQFRVIGSSWVGGNASTQGYFISTTVVNDAIEFTFYGTDCNVLLNLTTGSQDARYTVDGGAESGNILNSVYDSQRNGRNYSTNQIVQLASGLTLGVHTVRLRNNSTNGIKVYGFESIISGNTNVYVNKGSSYLQGKKYTTSSQQTFAYSAPVTGTTGGRALVYQNSDGSISQGFNSIGSSPTYLGSTDHSNEEIADVFHWRSFGMGNSSDMTATTFSGFNGFYTLDDNTTSLRLSGAGQSIFNAYDVLEANSSTGVGFTFTFVGTGCDIMRIDDTAGTTPQMTLTVDGVSQGTLSTSGTTKLKQVTLCGGLPYGTHVVSLKITAINSGSMGLVRFITYRPKTPSLPANTVKLATYNVMANFVANSSSTINALATGVLRKMNAREEWANQSTSSSAQPNWPSGFDIAFCTSGSFIELTFVGTGFDHRFIPTDGAGAAPTLTVSIDGLAPSTANFPAISSGFYGNVTSFSAGVAGTGAVVTTTNPSDNHSGFWVNGLTYGVHTVKILLTNTPSCGTGWKPACWDIITPIHSYDLFNGFYVGSKSIKDERKLLPSTATGSNRKNYVYLNNQNVSTTSSNYAPTKTQRATLETNGGPVLVMAPAQSGNSEIVLFVDGYNYGAASAGSWIIQLPPGKHWFDIYANTGGSPVTFNGPFEVIEL